MSGPRTALALTAAAVAAFLVYGSLLPFAFGPRRHDFATVVGWGVTVHSRSDALANVLVAVPLGFALLGAVAAGRGWGRAKTAAVGLALFPLCAAFSAAVEYAQLYTLTRHCTLSDIVAQMFGAAVGMAGWVLCGQALTGRAARVWDRTDGNPAARLLVAYLALALLIQALPLDLTPSPADLYRKVRERVTFRPFGEFAGADDLARWALFGKLAKLAGLGFPVGLLAARLKGPFAAWGLVRVAPAAVAVGFGLEAVQLVVQSRSPGVTDVLVLAAGAVAGWLAGKVHHEGLALPFAVSWGVVWLALMTPVSLPAAGAPRLTAPRPFDWVPGLPLESGSPLFVFEDVLMKLVLFGLLGVLVAAWRLPPRSRRTAPGSMPVAVAVAIALGLLASGLIEDAQRWTADRTPCVTDVLLGGLGAGLGVLAASRASPSGRGRSPTCGP